ncbi:MAG: EAL domain-containing protein, partial [Gallionellaceae bacterium]|nr:EAL domain-containing protein [Gallionellaceae bacterium]
ETRPHWLTVSTVKENGVTTHYVGTYTDITERKAAEELLRESDLRWKFAIEGSGDGVWDTNLQTGESQYSKRWKEMLGYTDEDILPTRQEWLKRIHPEDQSHVATSMQAYLEGKTPSYVVEYRLRCKDDSYQWILARGIIVSRSDDGKPLRMIGTHTDITDRKQHEQQLEHIAHYDALTSLPNRVLLADRLHQGMIQAQRRGQRLAVAYLDLDGFKAVNDNHGHETGDQLLITIASRMKQALRESDTLARLGGDEFVAVLTDLADIEASVPMLTRLLSAAAEPVHIGDLVLQVSASLGVTFYPQSNEVDADQLLRQADQAMYQAKLAGKNRYYVFDAAQDSSIRGHHDSLERIRRALISQEFVLHYQPKVNMRTGVVTGAEALIRWQHPEKGLLPPGVFLPVIEDHMLAVEVGEWVISTALTQMEIWHAVGLDIPVSVNVSARQLQELNFVDRLRETLSRHPNIRPGCLELEVLETSALEDMTHISKLIESCRSIGVKFSLDDFGTGYSSLTYLKRLPVTTLKIDQSFVRDMLDDPDDLSILQGILGLATAFNREVIAEGVETMAHGAMLLQLGCDQVQGYGIARPMPAHELPAWAATWRPDSSWVDLYRISRDDFALLFAGVEHRAWIVAIERFLKDEGKMLPPLDQHECRFGKWLNIEGILRHQTHPDFQPIFELHQQVHELATELLKLHLHEQKEQALARLPELFTLRDALLEQLKKLLLRKDH